MRLGFFVFFPPNLLSRLPRCSVRCNLGLSCRMDIPRGCFLDVSFLPSCLACFQVFLCYGRCKPWSRSARSFRWDLQHTGQLAKAWLALEIMCKPEHDSVNLWLRNDGGAEGGSGVQVFRLGTVERGVMVKAPKSLWTLCLPAAV